MTAAGQLYFPALQGLSHEPNLWFNASRLVDGKLTTFDIYIKLTIAGATTYDLAARTSVGATYSTTGPDASYEVQRVGAGTLWLTRLDSV
jgi:hypothetical protein